jgi:hypothetical protein
MATLLASAEAVADSGGSKGQAHRIEMDSPSKWLASEATLQPRFQVFGMSEAMSSGTNFLKLKIHMADFDNTIAAKHGVAFTSNVDGVPIGEKSATGYTALDRARTKKLEGKFRRRRRGRYRWNVIRVPRSWNSNNFDGRRRWWWRRQYAVENIPDGGPIFGILGSVDAIMMDPRALSAHRLVSDQERSCLRRSRFGVSVVIPNGSRSEKQ